MKKTVTIFQTIALAIIVLTLATVIGANLRFIYSINYSLYNVGETTYLTKAETFHIYNRLVDYLMPFYFHSFPFKDPSLASAETVLHFVEVKNIFNVLYIASLISLCVLIGGYFYNRSIKFIKYCFIFYVTVIPAIVLFILCFFDTAFVLFHKMLFRNDYWFSNDEIVTILPATFFMHTGIAIGILIIVIISLMYIAYRIYLKKGVKHDNKTKN